jgi:diguanylate cyclase (GGDEF)-like protein
MWKSLLKDGYWSGEIWNRRKSGEVYAVIKKISAVYDDQGNITHYFGLGCDITMMKKYQTELEHMAHFDTLTNLPNRSLFLDRLSQAMSQCNRHKQSLAVAFIDIDNFKSVNDTYGHDVGDDVLITLSIRMKEALREGDTLARIGGDEFVAILIDLTEPEDYEPVLERLLQASNKDVTCGDITFNLSASIGVSIYPQDNLDADQLLRQADQAMYIVKETGKNSYHLYDTDTDIDNKRC